jgi:hypothetical protein
MIVRDAKLNATSGIWKAGMPPLIEAISLALVPETATYNPIGNIRRSPSV